MTEGINHRQAWWCHIINDPFFVCFTEDGKPKCPLCDMVREDDGSWTMHDYRCTVTLWGTSIRDIHISNG